MRTKQPLLQVLYSSQAPPSWRPRPGRVRGRALDSNRSLESEPPRISQGGSRNAAPRKTQSGKTHTERDPDGEPGWGHNRELALLSRTLFALALTPRAPDGASVGSGLRPESWLQGQRTPLYTELCVSVEWRYPVSVASGLGSAPAAPGLLDHAFARRPPPRVDERHCSLAPPLTVAG
jgi:hypothetical protein